ncbi:hypothetical protein CEQ31_000930 [Serratia odorifera]|nr:hypothetical protein CEQ31_000930 [Serratia odorifera]
MKILNNLTHTYFVTSLLADKLKRRTSIYEKFSLIFILIDIAHVFTISTMNLNNILTKIFSIRYYMASRNKPLSYIHSIHPFRELIFCSATI